MNNNNYVSASWPWDWRASLTPATSVICIENIIYSVFGLTLEEPLINMPNNPLNKKYVGRFARAFDCYDLVTGSRGANGVRILPQANQRRRNSDETEFRLVAGGGYVGHFGCKRDIQSMERPVFL
jgi:hypothetical protein